MADVDSLLALLKEIQRENKADHQRLETHILAINNRLRTCEVDVARLRERVNLITIISNFFTATATAIVAWFSQQP